MKKIGCYFKCLNNYIGAIAVAATVGLTASIIDGRIIASKYSEHIINFQSFTREQQKINSSFLMFAESIKDLKNNGSVAMRNYVDEKAREVEARVNIRVDDDKNSMRIVERELRIVQSRLEKFNNHLESNNIVIGGSKR